MVIALEPTSDKVAEWLKGNFRHAVKEYFTIEIAQLWHEFVGDTPELNCKGGPDFMPDADLTQEVHARKTEVEKVLAFKPVADDFLNQQEDAIEEYVGGHVEYLKVLLTDQVGSGVGRSRADMILQLADEISAGPDDPPPLLVALYCVKHPNRLKG